MMGKRLKHTLQLFLASVIVCSLFSTTALAGTRTESSNFVSSSGMINDADWHSTDVNIVCEDQKLVIPAASSTVDTKFVSKIPAAPTSAEKMISVEATLRITALPQDEQFIMAFGLGNIEAYSGENGNIEIVFTNSNGLAISVYAYGEEVSTLLDNKTCGIPLNSQFSLNATITSKGVLIVDVNNKNICESELPVNGTGRFGILQTGSCGAEFTKLITNCHYYDTPENMNISEDFEDGEFNANVLCSSVRDGNGYWPSGCSIEDYQGNKVLMFRNTGLGYFGTLYQYSNFELCFDIPYFLQDDIYDEEHNLIAKRSNSVSVGFGEESARPQGEAYITDTDLILLFKDSSMSWMKKAYSVEYSEVGYDNICGEPEKNQGYSVKITVVDGVMVLKVKPLSGGDYKTVVTQKYEDFRSGYIYIWCTADGNFAIDNFTLTNLDENPKLIEVEYESSVMKAEDYVPTERELQLEAYKENAKETSVDKKGQEQFGVILFGGIICAVIIISGVIIGRILKRKNKKGGAADDEK